MMPSVPGAQGIETHLSVGNSCFRPSLDRVAVVVRVMKLSQAGEPRKAGFSDFFFKLSDAGKPDKAGFPDFIILFVVSSTECC